MPAKTTTFADLESALNALDVQDLDDDLTSAIDDLHNAESVETLADFGASLRSAEEMLRNTLARISALRARALELRAIGYRSQVVARDCGFDVYARTDFEGAQIAQSQSPLKPVDWRKAKTVRIYKRAPAQTR